MTKKKTRKTSHKKSTKNKRLHVINHSKNNIKITIGDRKKNTSQKKNIAQPRPTSNVIVTMPPQHPYFQMPQQYVNPFNQQQQTINTPQPPITSNPSLIATVTDAAQNTEAAGSVNQYDVRSTVGEAITNQSHQNEVGSIVTNQSGYQSSTNSRAIALGKFLEPPFNNYSTQNSLRDTIEMESKKEMRLFITGREQFLM